MKIIVKSFEGHVGRKGQVGGSAPRGTPRNENLQNSGKSGWAELLGMVEKTLKSNGYHIRNVHKRAVPGSTGMYVTFNVQGKSSVDTSSVSRFLRGALGKFNKVNISDTQEGWVHVELET